MIYRARPFEQLREFRYFSESLLEAHLKVYQGHVKNTNELAGKLLEMVKQGNSESMEYAEMKRRFGWEYNGMRLHELYFSNLTNQPMQIGKDSALYEKLWTSFGQFAAWERGFMTIGGMRGIGWVLLTQDVETGQLFNIWMDEHDTGFLIGSMPLLVMDVFEHAYLQDFGLNRTAYVQAFMKAIDWRVVEQRLTTATSFREFSAAGVDPQHRI